MDNAVLKTITAMGGPVPEICHVGGMTLTEDDMLALASLAERRGHSLAGVDATLAKPGAFSEADGVGALWIGPSQWMMMGRLQDNPDLAGDLKTRFGDAASVTDQTGAWVCFRLESADDALVDAAAALERLAGLDFVEMRSGAGTRTIVEHLGCLVVCRKARREFLVLGPRSSAESLHHALISAIRTATAIAESKPRSPDGH